MIRYVEETLLLNMQSIPRDALVTQTIIHFDEAMGPQIAKRVAHVTKGYLRGEADDVQALAA